MAILLAAPPAWADDVDREALALSEEVMSPFCPGKVLASCPSPDAAALRSEIRDRLRAGATRDSVLAALTARYGDTLLAAPRPQGWGLLAWLVPAAAVGIGGAGVAAWLLRHHRRPPASLPHPGAPIDPAHAAELERLLREP